MTRIPRQEIIAPHQLYHITVRGNNQQNIFLSRFDYEYLTNRLKFYHQKMDFSLFAYVLMKNHFHFLIETGSQYSISKIMGNLNTSYAMYFKKKYGHSGHVFQGRFNAKLVDKDNYFLESIRYIHLNPVRAKLVKHPKEYYYSSYHEYAGTNKKDAWTEYRKALEIFGGDMENQRARFKEFIKDMLPNDMFSDGDSP